ncbi:MAG: hypothetical protein LBT16_11200 [Treponema sp.]|jgi:hypothetical protein|nr:hypothetical protein [Treponema sp.]
MHAYSATVNNAIPAEYRETAEGLFPPGGFPHGPGGFPQKGPGLEQALAFAEMLGAGGEYRRLLAASPAEKARFLSHFGNNINLLIQKTWVEKVDESRKEKLQDRVPGLVEAIKGGNYRGALTEFGDILDELANLFFGAQSRREDFTEYTLRIDPQIGLFWWYGRRLAYLAKIEDAESFYPVLLIGLCYLTNF